MSEELIQGPLLKEPFWLPEHEVIFARRYMRWSLEVRATIFKIEYEDVLKLKQLYEEAIFDKFIERISKRYECKYEGNRVGLKGLVAELMGQMDISISWETIRKQAKERRLSEEIMQAINDLIESNLVEVQP